MKTFENLDVARSKRSIVIITPAHLQDAPPIAAEAVPVAQVAEQAVKSVLVGRTEVEVDRKLGAGSQRAKK